MIHEIRDITILGGGPAGLFAMFYAGMRGSSCQIVDALPELGGQLSALYPEKFIFDVAGFPKILAKDLVLALATQAVQFGQPAHLAQRVTALRDEDGHFVLETATDSFPTRALIVAAGTGAFSARKLPQQCAAPWYGRGVYDRVLTPDDYRGRNVLIIGGGDSAFDWAQQLMHRDARVTLVHRSDRFRAHAATVADVMAASESGRARVLTFHELADIHATNDAISSVTLRDIKGKSTLTLDADVILPMLGFVSDLGPLAQWGLTLEKNHIVVNSQMETGRPGVYAAGDIATYPGKLPLIALGFSEAAIAVNQAVHWIHPEKKVAPGHSSNMALFGQTDD
jgi:thioredoxin reductase